MKMIKTVILTSLMVIAQSAFSADYTLRIHQLLPLQSNVPKYAIEEWAERVEEQSGGRIDVQHFPSMQLGGSPPQLLDQARDGMVDVAWIMLGYTPGRFPQSEVFELPFIAPRDPVEGSVIFHRYVNEFTINEFRGVKLLAAHIAGPGVFHSKKPINSLADLKGTQTRAASRLITMLLDALGAEPVGMPATSIGEAMSKGVLDAATLQWESIPAMRIEQMVHNHTEVSGDYSLYTGTFAFVMNPNSYNRLPKDLQAVIDANSGEELSRLFGNAMKIGDENAREEVKNAGNNIITLDEETSRQWEEKAKSVWAEWIRAVEKNGVDGEQVIKNAQSIINPEV